VGHLAFTNKDHLVFHSFAKHHYSKYTATKYYQYPTLTTFKGFEKTVIDIRLTSNDRADMLAYIDVFKVKIFK